MENCLKNLLYIQNNIKKIEEKVQSIYTSEVEKKPSNDVDQSLYDGFISNGDRAICNQIQSLSIDEIEHFQPNFKDRRLTRLFLNFKARNYPQLLDEFEQEQWFEIVQSRIQNGENGFLSIDSFENSLYKLKESTPEKHSLWRDLEKYAQSFL